MRRVVRIRRGVAVAAGLVVLGACTTANPVDARITNPVRQSSVNASVGNLRLLATRVEAPDDAQHLQNGNVGLFTTLANDGTSADKLVGVSTVYARQVVYRVGEGAESPIAVNVPAKGVASMQYPGGPHLELVDLKVDVAWQPVHPGDVPIREQRVADDERVHRGVRVPHGLAADDVLSGSQNPEMPSPTNLAPRTRSSTAMMTVLLCTNHVRRFCRIAPARSPMAR